jgi:AraC-like DNA-binding protein
MSAQVFIPSDILKPFVKSIVITINPVAASYTILPGTSIVMGFQFSGKLALRYGEKTIALKAAGITGLMDTYKVFSNAVNTGSILVMFNETGAAAFFGQPMHEIFGQSLALDDLILTSQMDIVIQQLNEAGTDTERVAVVENFLTARLKSHERDEVVNAAVTAIKQHAGNIKISQLVQGLFISQGRLEKRFRKIVGTSPKKFASLVRLRSLADAGPKPGSLTERGLEAGFFDQAHFIKDFKSFTGQTPEEFFKPK